MTRPSGRGSAFWAPDVGLFRFWNFHIDDGPSAGDLGGNIEVVPPTASWPLGRILVGDTISPKLLRFLEDQGVQSPFQIGVNWLRVGHVDEALAIVPAEEGWTLVVADPAQARALLEPLAPDAVFFARGDTASGLDLKASAGGTGTELLDSAGTDYRRPEWDSMEYVRIYDGTGAGPGGADRFPRQGRPDRPQGMADPDAGSRHGLSRVPRVGRRFRQRPDRRDQRRPPQSRWFEVPDETSRYVLAEDTLFWLDAVGREAPALIRVHEVRSDSLMWALNEEAASRLE